jgi:hypothetical protein
MKSASNAPAYGQNSINIKKQKKQKKYKQKKPQTMTHKEDSINTYLKEFKEL